MGVNLFGNVTGRNTSAGFSSILSLIYGTLFLSDAVFLFDVCLDSGNEKAGCFYLFPNKSLFDVDSSELFYFESRPSSFSKVEVPCS